jgi:hypothetical protein
VTTSTLSIHKTVKIRIQSKVLILGAFYCVFAKLSRITCPTDRVIHFSRRNEGHFNPADIWTFPFYPRTVKDTDFARIAINDSKCCLSPSNKEKES